MTNNTTGNEFRQELLGNEEDQEYEVYNCNIGSELD